MDRTPELRASDAEREQTAELLRRAAAEGRLTVDELEARLRAAFETPTRAELDKLVADVVVEAPPRRVPVRRGDGGESFVLSIMSGSDRRGSWRIARSCRVVNVMGGADLDLNDAELGDDVVELTVFSLMGGSDVHLPDGLNVEVSDFALMGANDVRVGDDRPDVAGPLLRLKLISIMGGTNVRRGRRRTRAERREEKRRRGHLHH